MTDTQTIKDRLDIVQIIGEYVPLKKAGANWKARCPFHNEKSPSFMVHQDKQIWHCFGCSKGGDVFSFVQEMEGLAFPEALRLLAKRAGVAIDTFVSEIQQSQRNRLLEINTAAAYFFHRFLLDMDAAKAARDYLERRQLKKQTILDWQIGYIPDQWDLLTKYLLKKGFGIDDLVASGLTIKRDGADAASGRGYYDRFRGRVMFPICDTHGNVIGFTGRVLVETEHSGGKYVNTPQTLLYDKSRVLYGIHKAKTEIKAKDLAILVEGQMDVIACHQAGMTNVIAASGTALTNEQIKLLKRYTNNIAMALDADTAGQAAGKRGSDLAEKNAVSNDATQIIGGVMIGDQLAIEEGMNVKFIRIPDHFAKDADECLKKDPLVWFKAVADAKEAIAWYFEDSLSHVDRNNPKSKDKAVKEFLSKIRSLPSAVERDEWLKRLSEAVRVEANILREELKKIKIEKVPVAASGRFERPAVSLSTSQLGLLGQEFWSLLLKFPEYYGELAGVLRKEYFVDAGLTNLYETAQSVYNESTSLVLDTLRSRLQTEGAENSVDVLLLRPYSFVLEITPAVAKGELEQLAGRIREEWRRTRRAEIQHEIAVAERGTDQVRLNELLVELQSL